MWPQQPQQGIPFQQGQYPSYAYNNSPNMPQQQTPHNYSTIDPHMANINETAIDPSFKRQSEGPILWFAGPPLNVIPEKEPVHSIAYLHWKNQRK